MSPSAMTPAACPRCGTTLPAQAPEELCPTCVLTAMARELSATSPQAPPSRPETPASRATWEPRFYPGEHLGPYRIDRLLGRGGMGEVYEAEHLGHGRRVALKVLNERLRRRDDRARFLEEGRLAASLNHPNSVYIFGTEEFVGNPVITMELLPGGTLKDRVRADGPLGSSQAADAMLQVIAGLEAAHAVGALHRDVKPSNCFIDRDGTIKVGDFGLSISMLPRHVTAPDALGAFQGTPEFAAPEQLRGGALDVRADIYAVGATLFYLLTGRPPFDADNPTALIERIQSGPAPSVRSLQPAISRELDALVRRCLARDRADRFPNYKDLAQELRRFSSEAWTLAPIGRRLTAGLVDAIVLTLFAGLVLGALVGLLRVEEPVAALATALLFTALSYGILSVRLGGATLGMHASSIQVTTDAGARPGWLQSFERSTVFLAPLVAAVLLALATSRAWPSAQASWLPSLVLVAAGIALPFVTATRDNGLLGIHDRLSRTRVVMRKTDDVGQTTPVSQPPLMFSKRPSTHIGPYTIVEPLSQTDVGELFSGFDPALKRPVWLHVVSAGAPALPEGARGSSRLGRLHWLNGQRAPFGGWDAYGAVEGQPLRSIAQPQSWSVVRRWLLDLATEFDARAREGLTEPLDIDRVWIANDGHAKLLAFRAPGAPDVAAMKPIVSAQQFLSVVASRGLSKSSVPTLPLSAANLLRDLESGTFKSTTDVVSILRELSGKPDHLTPTVRNCALAASFVAAVIGVPVLRALAARSTFGFVGVGESICFALAVLWSVIFRSGFWLRAFGIAVVTADGREATRARALARACVAWSWVPIQVAAALNGWGLINTAAGILKVFGVAGSAAPSRGVQDRLTGTFLVPR